MRAGGRVEWLLEPEHPDQLVKAYRVARERGLEPRILGGGANLLVPDGVLPGVVIATDRMARVFRAPASASADEVESAFAKPPSPGERVAGTDGDARLVAWAGAGLPGLVRTARELGWTGLEGLVGVPGHLGGGVAMNAGGRWGELWDVVESVRLLLPDGAVVHRERAACAPRYRDGRLAGAVCLGAVLRLQPGERAEIKERMRQYLFEKSAAQPVTEHSCGCVFKNPPQDRSDGRSAGQLVEECGGKRLARGDAVVSPKHGNFIVNRGRATATDVLDLIEDVRALVFERTGIELESEVKIWRHDERVAEVGA